MPFNLEEPYLEPDEVMNRFKDRPFNWQEIIGKFADPEPEEVLTVAEHFEMLRKQGPGWSRYQMNMMDHLEYHLDKGDVICRCWRNSI